MFLPIMNSLLLIVLLHYLYMFFINTLTEPKTIDMIHNPLAQYNEIQETLTRRGRAPMPPPPIQNLVVDVAAVTSPTDTMQDELRSFLQDLKRG
jgi:hypothetical protein